ncbi:ArsR/SmtB family transcription factor [Streptomyces mobaraensis]|uniref:Winged helix-turn-helix transcriptional regulator n=1 Tax=Streptomyces mobaraensis TaxID=35621 RepID=A0A5N5W6Y6_STRMB|nr:winged helix-turn-helix domain-containing protein [Streptomyces mobaraensis]KAB7843730.1 winged helix-turn-helix transcriptional regulator [Streptomyces mobaraensis]
MLRLHFTAEDLLRVSFATEPAPLTELVTAMALLQRRSLPPVLSGWQRRTRRALPVRAGILTSLVPPSARGPMFLDPLSRGLEDGLDTVLRSPAARVRSELDHVCPAVRPRTPWVRRLACQDREAWQLLEDALRDAYDTVLAGSWNHVRSAFDAERAWRTRLLADHGLLTTLADLGPGGRWEGTTLIYDCPEDAEGHLSGHGVVLLPSVLWQGRPLVALRDDGPSVLLYASTATLPLLGPGPDGASPTGLAALLGRTRAAVLHLLVRQRTTTEIARELGIGKSSASEHAKALRAARLVCTRRDGNVAWHWCTPLGLDLLAATGQAADRSDRTGNGPGPAITSYPTVRTNPGGSRLPWPAS